MSKQGKWCNTQRLLRNTRRVVVVMMMMMIMMIYSKLTSRLNSMVSVWTTLLYELIWGL